MGAWGYKPDESDHGGDWLVHALSKSTEPLIVLIEKTLDKPLENTVVEHEIRAAAFLLETISDLYPYDGRKRLLALAIYKLQAMIDNGWADRWDDPRRMQKDLRRQSDALQQRLVPTPPHPRKTTNGANRPIGSLSVTPPVPLPPGHRSR